MHSPVVAAALAMIASVSPAMPVQAWGSPVFTGTTTRKRRYQTMVVSSEAVIENWNAEVDRRKKEKRK